MFNFSSPLLKIYTHVLINQISLLLGGEGVEYLQNNKIYFFIYCKYDFLPRLETGKLRNVAKFFGHLFFTDAIGNNYIFLLFQTV